MNEAVFTTVVVTGFSVAFLHAAIPTHWLPFVLTARIQKWSRSKTLLITGLAGTGHVLFTAVLGFLVAWGGIALNDEVGSYFPWLAGAALVMFGLYYVLQQLRGKGHGHSHIFGGHSHGCKDHGDSGFEHGPLGGVLVNTGHGEVEITVFEEGVPPRFRLFFYNEQRQGTLVPGGDAVKIETLRQDGARQVFAFRAEPEYLESTSSIPEPHEFTAILELSHGNHAHSYEVAFREDDHGYQHGHKGGHQEEEVQPTTRKSDWAAILSLLALLTFSPCEGFLPVYVSGVRYGWKGFFLLTLILSVATVFGMVIFTALTLMGMERLKLNFLEKYERGILGSVLVLLGLLVIFFEH